jgi:putative membrane protein
MCGETVCCIHQEAEPVMWHFILNWIVMTIAILVAAYVIPGIIVESIGAAFVAAAILGILNVIIRPVLVFFTLPFTIVTFGLFLFVINALMLWLAGSLSPGFRVQSFIPALLGSLVITCVRLIAGLVI